MKTMMKTAMFALAMFATASVGFAQAPVPAEGERPCPAEMGEMKCDRPMMDKPKCDMKGEAPKCDCDCAKGKKGPRGPKMGKRKGPRGPRPEMHKGPRGPRPEMHKGPHHGHGKGPRPMRGPKGMPVEGTPVAPEAVPAE